ncbi:RNA-directed DNA polymerase, eukaryota, partial [Tanacetum coccineum]
GNGDDENGNLDDDGEGHKDPSRSNPSFGFSKISLDNFGNGSGKSPNNQVVEKEPVDSTVEGTVGDLFGENLGRMEVLNQGPLTPERMPTHASNGDKIENVFEAHSGKFSVYGIHLNLETLAPGLWIDANVIDCWGAILKHEEKFRDGESKSRHFFPTGGITKSMFDGTLASCDDKGKAFQIKLRLSLKAMKVIWLLKAILEKLFARHLKLYGHNRHSKVGKLKQTIPNLKWRTKGDIQDCGVFTMLHMETFNGGTAANWDCGLVVESHIQSDMLRRLRFKFSTKILLHDVTPHKFQVNILNLSD